jgi:signal transduction histidine kinase
MQRMRNFGARATLKLVEIAARWVTTLVAALLALGDDRGMASWGWPVVLGALLLNTVLVAAARGRVRRAICLLDLAGALALSLATPSLAVHLATFMLVAFWVTTLSPRSAAALSLALTVGLVGVEAREGEALHVVITEILAVGIAGLWVTIFAWVFGRRWRDAQGRLRRLEASRDRILDEALAAEAHALLVVGADIHDGPLQLLITAAQDLDDAEEPMAQEARVLVRRAIVDLRNVLAAAKPDNERQHVEIELGDWCVVLSSRRRFTWSVDIDRDLERIDPIAVAATREFITNAAKHSGCSTLRARIARDGEWVVIEVEDDGQQIPEGTLEGFGLTALRRRVEGAGGTLALGRRPGGRGTVAVAQIPFRSEIPEARGTDRPRPTFADELGAAPLPSRRDIPPPT